MTTSNTMKNFQPKGFVSFEMNNKINNKNNGIISINKKNIDMDNKIRHNTDLNNTRALNIQNFSLSKSYTSQQTKCIKSPVNNQTNCAQHCFNNHLIAVHNGEKVNKENNEKKISMMNGADKLNKKDSSNKCIKSNGINDSRAFFVDVSDEKFKSDFFLSENPCKNSSSSLHDNKSNLTNGLNPSSTDRSEYIKNKILPTNGETESTKNIDTYNFSKQDINGYVRKVQCETLKNCEILDKFGVNTAIKNSSFDEDSHQINFDFNIDTVLNQNKNSEINHSDDLCITEKENDSQQLKNYSLKIDENEKIKKEKEKDDQFYKLYYDYSTNDQNSKSPVAFTVIFVEENDKIVKKTLENCGKPPKITSYRNEDYYNNESYDFHNSRLKEITERLVEKRLARAKSQPRAQTMSTIESSEQVIPEKPCGTLRSISAKRCTSKAFSNLDKKTKTTNPNKEVHFQRKTSFDLKTNFSDKIENSSNKKVVQSSNTRQNIIQPLSSPITHHSRRDKEPRRVRNPKSSKTFGLQIDRQNLEGDVPNHKKSTTKNLKLTEKNKSDTSSLIVAEKNEEVKTLLAFPDPNVLEKMVEKKRKEMKVEEDTTSEAGTYVLCSDEEDSNKKIRADIPKVFGVVKNDVFCETFSNTSNKSCDKTKKPLINEVSMRSKTPVKRYLPNTPLVQKENEIKSKTALLPKNTIGTLSETKNKNVERSKTRTPPASRKLYRRDSTPGKEIRKVATTTHSVERSSKPQSFSKATSPLHSRINQLFNYETSLRNYSNESSPNNSFGVNDSNLKLFKRYPSSFRDSKYNASNKGSSKTDNGKSNVKRARSAGRLKLDVDRCNSNDITKKENQKLNFTKISNTKNKVSQLDILDSKTNEKFQYGDAKTSQKSPREGSPGLVKNDNSFNNSTFTRNKPSINKYNLYNGLCHKDLQEHFSNRLTPFESVKIQTFLEKIDKEVSSFVGKLKCEELSSNLDTNTENTALKITNNILSLDEYRHKLENEVLHETSARQPFNSHF